MKKSIFLLAFALLSFSAVAAGKYTLKSPDGRLSIEVNLSPALCYSLSDGDNVLVQDSRIGMTLDNGLVLGAEGKAPKVSRRTVDSVIPATVYKKREVADNYNELCLNFVRYSVIFRLYDDGMAYRFVTVGNKPYKVQNEVAEFNFSPGNSAIASYVRGGELPLESQFGNSFENTYSRFALEYWDKTRLAFLPVMVECPDGVKLNIMESDLRNYPGMYLYNSDADSGLEAVFAPYPAAAVQGGHNELQMIVSRRKEYIAQCEGGRPFPWRIISLSRNDAQMADNDMVYRLAETPDPNVDYSWVKPGKVAWEWWNHWTVRGEDFVAGVNDETYKYFIDFASENGIEYVIMDEGWAVNGNADLFDVVPSIHLEELVSYAAKKNVGIILWAGYWAFHRDMDKVCSYYSEMGVKGFKVDFMDRDDQKMVAFHEEAAQTCAKYHLLVDFHGTYKPTGLNRTYPNVINFEGVHGLEQVKWADEKTFDQVSYDVTIPYIRMAAGPMDYTQGAMRNASRNNFRGVSAEPMSQGTRCRQLALYVVLESPLNMLCDAPANYRQEAECLEFISKVPTVWDETRALDGKVGEYIVMSRRSGDKWYVGALTGWTSRDLTIDLGFLPDNDYELILFRDGANSDIFASDYKKETCKLPADRKINVHLSSGGGCCAIIVPAASVR